MGEVYIKKSLDLSARDERVLKAVIHFFTAMSEPKRSRAEPIKNKDSHQSDKRSYVQEMMMTL